MFIAAARLGRGERKEGGKHKWQPSLNRFP